MGSKSSSLLILSFWIVPGEHTWVRRKNFHVMPSGNPWPAPLTTGTTSMQRALKSILKNQAKYGCSEQCSHIHSLACFGRLGVCGVIFEHSVIEVAFA